MIYDSLDTIPLKLYLKISQTGDVSLLTDDKEQLARVQSVWEQLDEEFKALDPENKINKTLHLLIEIEEYTAQYDGLQFAISALQFDRDIDLENALREQGFKLREETFLQDLIQIKHESEALIMFIEECEAQLPKHNNKKATNVDEVILGYCSITGLQYTDTNKITVTQFYALKKMFDEKLQILKKQEATLKGKKK